MEIETRPLTLANGPLTLEAALHCPLGMEPLGLVVVCHPHPQYGGAMDNSVVLTLCEAALQEGMAALRFNFRGVGASGGSYEGGAGERTDVQAALAQAALLPGGGRLALAGYSFGAAMAVGGGCSGRLAPLALALVSPPLQMLGAAALRVCRLPLLLIAGDQDPICPAGALQELAAQVDPPASAEVIEGADHSWYGYEAELRDSTAGFLRWQLGGISS